MERKESLSERKESLSERKESLSERKESLSDCVRKNLFRLRKSLKLNQEDLGNALGMKRSGYTRKETGNSPITLEDLDKILGFFVPNE